MSRRFRIEEFFSEFSFLTTGENPIVADQDKVERVRVSRISPELLEKAPRSTRTVGHRVDINEREQIDLLDQDGNCLGTVNEELTHTDHSSHDSSSKVTLGETVGETLLRIENPDVVHFVIVVNTGYRLHNHESVGGYSVTLYKAPKGFSLRAWVDEQLAHARASIASQVAAIDAEATTKKVDLIVRTLTPSWLEAGGKSAVELAGRFGFELERASLTMFTYCQAESGTVQQRFPDLEVSGDLIGKETTAVKIYVDLRDMENLGKGDVFLNDRALFLTPCGAQKLLRLKANQGKAYDDYRGMVACNGGRTEMRDGVLHFHAGACPLVVGDDFIANRAQ